MKTFTLTVDYHGDAESWEEIRNNAENNKIPNVFIGAKEFVNVVRCKECKHFINGYCYSDNFVLRFEEVKPDWFCADGARRQDGNT